MRPFGLHRTDVDPVARHGVTVTVMETSDLHGNTVNWDYVRTTTWA